MNDNLNKAFEDLKAYDWGQDTKVLNPIEEAILESADDASARRELETQLVAVLQSDVPYDAKQYVCRKLMQIGAAASVPALATLLTDAKLSHMARYALERIPAPDAGQAMRDALAKVDGELKIGVIASLGKRGEADSVAPLKALLRDSDAAVAKAAAYALGTIGTPEANRALAADNANDDASRAIADASLICAENLLADGKSSDALATYKRLLDDNPSQVIRSAAERGCAACRETSQR